MALTKKRHEESFSFQTITSADFERSFRQRAWALRRSDSMLGALLLLCTFPDPGPTPTTRITYEPLSLPRVADSASRLQGAAEESIGKFDEEDPAKIFRVLSRT